MGGRHTGDGLRGTDLRNAAGVAVDTPVMADLKIERSIAEIGAALDAKSASRAERLIDVILEIRIFDEGADDRVDAPPSST